MTMINCEREHAVRSALSGDEWTPELLEHIAGCPACADLALVDRFLSERSRELASGLQVPDPSFVWWRAQLAARAAAAQRATRIITVVQKLAVAFGGLVAARGVAGYWPQIREALAQVVPESLPSPLPSDMAPPGLVMLASLAVVALLLVFDLREPRTGD